ncbi:DAK2 domain-containing protein [Lachnospiraceae bacterium CLA-AA-H215]|uniref:DAK2 domain-containing protein n=1 Tax=Hominifimenecus microfluidus TaxID=2885348 RepID=A0AAE3EBE3_9FIRM|nr:DAK2 domain-containing protein [Hominifimenecus microfluidus]MCC2231390.1 DAK2 domain-containing protein [Hominifimenecus microfluidus]
MSNNTIDARLLRQMFLAGAKNLELNKEWINDLNVFPVPDGDTGTNMTLTILSAVKEVQNLSEVTMETLSKAISSGSLRGARGNSGVILSQLFRGFTKELKTLELLDRPAAARALQRATETAYKAVMKPKEGTILTVARGISDKAAELAEEEGDMESFLEQLISHGEYVLSCTPDMLPVLKQAGVVDSGGQGLIQVLKGTYDGLLGKEIEAPQAAEQKPTAEEKASAGAASADLGDIKFGYCTEFIINLEKEFPLEEEHSFKAYLESIGDSIVVVADDEIVKVHVHTNDPGLAIQKALTYGSLSRMKIDNMREEHEEKLIREASRVAAEEKVKEQAAAEAAKASEPRKEAGFVAVSIGDGLAEIFRGLNVDYIIEGGQTMNPSTEDMLQAVDHVNADTVYIFPNNKNIILAAEQAAHLVIDKQIIVVPSTTVPQGITGVISYSPSRTPEENREVMIEEMKRVKTGQVTYAVRNTTIDDRPIHEGDIMGIGDHSSLLAVGSDIASVTQDMLEAMVNEESELISIYYGADITEEDAEKMQMAVEASYPDCDVEVHYGGQPIYYYIVSVE